MLSGRENVTYMDNSTVEQQSYYGYYTPKNQNCSYWLRFTPVNINNTLLIISQNKNLRFKLYNANDLNKEIYDSNSYDTVHKKKYIDGDVAAEKDKFELTVGNEYYIEIYNGELINTTVLDEDKFRVFVGTPLTRTGVKFFSAKSSATGTYSSYSQFVPITISDVPSTAMATSVNMNNDSGVRPSQIGAWQVKNPLGLSGGKSASYLPLTYSYDVNSSNNTKLLGEWNVKFKATRGSQTITMVPSLQISYTYEYGD
jgi:hypothetical protein